MGWCGITARHARSARRPPPPQAGHKHARTPARRTPPLRRPRRFADGYGESYLDGATVRFRARAAGVPDDLVGRAGPDIGAEDVEWVAAEETRSVKARPGLARDDDVGHTLTDSFVERTQQMFGISEGDDNNRSN